MFDEFKTIVLSIANIELPLLKSSNCKHVKSNRTNKNKISSKYLKTDANSCLIFMEYNGHNIFLQCIR